MNANSTLEILKATPGPITQTLNQEDSNLGLLNNSVEESDTKMESRGPGGSGYNENLDQTFFDVEEDFVNDNDGKGFFEGLRPDFGRSWD